MSTTVFSFPEDLWKQLDLWSKVWHQLIDQCFFQAVNLQFGLLSFHFSDESGDGEDAEKKKFHSELSGELPALEMHY